MATAHSILMQSLGHHLSSVFSGLHAALRDPRAQVLDSDTRRAIRHIEIAYKTLDHYTRERFQDLAVAIDRSFSGGSTRNTVVYAHKYWLGRRHQ